MSDIEQHWIDQLINYLEKRTNQGDAEAKRIIDLIYEEFNDG